MSIFGKAKEIYQQQQQALSRALNNNNNQGQQEPKAVLQQAPNKQEIAKSSTGASHQDQLKHEIEHLKTELELLKEYKEQNVALKAQLSQSVDKKEYEKLKQQLQHKQAQQNDTGVTSLQKEIGDGKILQDVCIQTDLLNGDTSREVVESTVHDNRMSQSDDQSDLMVTLQEKLSQFQQQLNAKDLQIEQKNLDIAKLKGEMQDQIEQIGKDYQSKLAAREKEILAQVEKKHAQQSDGLLKNQKISEEKDRMIVNLQMKLNESQVDNEQSKNKLTQLMAHVESLQDQISDNISVQESLKQSIVQLQDTCNDYKGQIELLNAELHASRQSQDRQSKSLMEKIEALKQLKLRLDAENSSNQKLAQQYDSLQEDFKKNQQFLQELQQKKLEGDVKINDLTGANQTLQESVKLLTGDRDLVTQQLEQVKSSIAILQQELDNTKTVSESKIKDLTSQLTEAKANAFPKDATNMEIWRKKDAEIKQLSDKVSKMAKDLDIKSKMVIQYALRENASMLTPAQLKRDASLSSLQQIGKQKSSTEQQLLTEINAKLQSIIADITTKNFELEEEIKGLKDLIRRQSVVASSNTSKF
ncbi:hypothetical protein MIR68_000110 [Amoeboaphelidium protococcarum]|nr:hypothetical protein MIR68_000110 [Amoeboaphelidium protococcarum]